MISQDACWVHGEGRRREKTKRGPPSYQRYPQMNRLVVEKPVTKRSLGAHHVRVLLRCHALLVLLC